MTVASLGLQYPGARSGHLLEELLAAAEGAERGGGIFAFASADGIKAVLGTKVFEAFLQKGSFDLTVGVDAVTNLSALDELVRARERFPTLSARVMVHSEAVLFHPKLSWFRSGKELTVLVGSGNLTNRGLHENWEAFGKLVLVGPRADEAEEQIYAWLERQEDLLVAPDDQSARSEAAKNTGKESSLRHPASKAAKPTPPVTAEVFVAEASKGGARPSQVNFHRQHYEGFFGARPGTGRLVSLHQVFADGSLGEHEIRPSSGRKSRNYSFELTGFKGVPPSEVPAIGIYVRVAPGAFLYQRIPPGEPGHDELDQFLKERWTGSKRFMRQIVASLASVRRAWPDSPIWKAEIPSS